MALGFYSIGTGANAYMNKAFKIIESNIYQPKIFWMKFRADREDTPAIVADISSGPVTKY
jgi:hypothetical protein